MAITLNGTTGISSPGGDTSTSLATTNLSYTGTLTGGTGVIAIGTNQIYKDASGNVGLSVIPSAWTSATGLQVQNAAIEGRSSLPSYGTFSANAFSQAGVWKYISSDYASRYTQYQANHYWYTAGTGTANNTVSDFATAKMTLDASGNLGLGAASTGYKFYVSGATPSGGIFVQSNSGSDNSPVVRVQGQRNDSNPSQSFSGGLALEKYYSGGTITSGQVLGTIYFGGNYSGSTVGYTASISAVASASWGGSTTAYTDLVFLTGTNTTGLGVPNTSYGTERARIDSSGNLLVGDTAFSYGYNGRLFARNDVNTTPVAATINKIASGNVYGIINSFLSNGNNTSSYHFSGVTQGVNQWYLYGNGTSSFTSDERKKKNIETTRNGYLEDLCKLRVVKYNWWTDDDGTPKELGLIAQEVEQIFPGLITNAIHPDVDGETYKVMKGSVIPFMLLKAIQELTTRLEALEAK